MKNKKTTELEKASAGENDSDDETCEKESGLLYCPEVGCIKSIQHFSSLGKHLWLYALEQETLYDKAKTQLNWSIAVMPFCKWRRRCIVREWKSSATDVMGSEVSDSNRENLTDAQKNFLTEVFQEREHTSKKADPSIISKAMRRAKLSNGSKRTTSSQQIVGLIFFLNSEKFNFQHSRWRFWRTWGKRRERHPRAYWSRN